MPGELEKDEGLDHDDYQDVGVVCDCGPLGVRCLVVPGPGRIFTEPGYGVAPGTLPAFVGISPVADDALDDETEDPLAGQRSRADCCRSAGPTRLADVRRNLYERGEQGHLRLSLPERDWQDHADRSGGGDRRSFVSSR